MTPRQQWAMRRNWLLKRLKGAKSIFSIDNCLFMNKLLPLDKQPLIDSAEIVIDALIRRISESKYKE